MRHTPYGYEIIDGKAIVDEEKAAQEAAAKAARLAYKKLDMAAAKGIIHKNQAANRKSKVAKKVNSIAQ